MKRKVDSATSSPVKRVKATPPDSHLMPSRRGENDNIIWPAPQQQIDRAREIIRECAKAQLPTLLLPDKDADGLSAGAILHHTLTTLGLTPSLISVHFPPKGKSLFDDTTLAAISNISPSPSYIFVLDQGSRKSAPLLSTPHTCLIIDHHHINDASETSSSFPENATYVTAHDCPPVATASFLTHHICADFHPEIACQTAWLAVLGTHGDLGTAFQWQSPFPNMQSTFARYPRKQINEAVALVNAARRSHLHNAVVAWDAVLATAVTGPSRILSNKELRNAAEEVQRETSRCMHAGPKFSRDGTIAVLEISSAAQVHPLIATRWAGFLKSEKLEIVMCANRGYVEGRVHFSCRVAKNAKARVGEGKVDIIQRLEGIVADEPELRERMGDNFARGHKEASGGVVGVEEWEGLKGVMGVGEKERKPVQKNKLTNYFTISKRK